MPSDAEGAAPAEIGEEARGVRFAYTLATYCNPTGQTMSAERRKQLIEKAEQYDFWIVEDDPYGELWYEKKPPISIRNLAPYDPTLLLLKDPRPGASPWLHHRAA